MSNSGSASEKVDKKAKDPSFNDSTISATTNTDHLQKRHKNEGPTVLSLPSSPPSNRVREQQGDTSHRTCNASGTGRVKGKKREALSLEDRMSALEESLKESKREYQEREKARKQRWKQLDKNMRQTEKRLQELSKGIKLMKQEKEKEDQILRWYALWEGIGKELEHKYQDDPRLRASRRAREGIYMDI